MTDEHGGSADAAIAAAVAALAAGQAIGLPTETVYGLAADAANREGVATIYRIKGRPSDHPLIVHVLDDTRARLWAQWTDAAQRLADAFWPGPLSIVLMRRAGAPAWACAAQSTIALRAPSHPVARRLMTALRAEGITGLAAPSANRFGRVSPTSAAHVRDDLGDEVAIVLEGGPAEVGIESTIVDLSRGRPVLLRPGHIGVDQLARALGEPVAAADREAPRVPGSLPSHYAPVTPLALVAVEDLPARIAGERAAGRRVGVWSVAPVAAAAHDDGVCWYRRANSVEAMERTLYERLREMDSSACDLIIVEIPPKTAAWAAIRDRLGRAAA
jgi:L-threonylcarbamoyladenylate synthase